MKTLQEIKELQYKLDKQSFICPICEGEEKWWTYNRHGCDKAFNEYMKDSRRQEQIEEQQNA